MARRIGLTAALAIGLMAVGGAGLADQPTPPVSPWKAPLWSQGSPEMRQYICRHAKSRPDWCAAQDAVAAVYDPPLQELYGPLLSGDDVSWLRLLAETSLDELSAEDATFIEMRAETTGDPAAMEILAYLYARGIGVRRDAAQAYIWYGRAFLKGQRHVKENMNILWAEISEKNPAAARRITDLFAEAQARPSPQGRTKD